MKPDDLTSLLAIRAIEQAYFQYCAIIDAKDFARLDEVFLGDARQDYRSSNGILQVGVAPLVERLTMGMGPESDCGATQHNVTNIRVVMGTGEATAAAHFYAVHAGRNAWEGAIYRCWGQYDDRWILTDDGWRIAERAYRNFLTEGPVAIIRKGYPAARSSGA